MTHLHRQYDVPGDYIHNTYNFKKGSSEVATVDVNIDHFVYELMKCGSDRNKFEGIMSCLEEKFMDGEILSSEDEMSIQDSNNMEGRDDLNSSKFSHIQNDYRLSNRNVTIKDSLRINTPPINHFYDEGINLRIHNNKHKHSSQNSLRQKKAFIQKKYTDVHANSKCHYPHNYEEDVDELSLDKSQWTNRANTSLLYSEINNKSNKSYVYSQRPFDSYENFNGYPAKFNSYFKLNNGYHVESNLLNRDNI